MKIYYDPEVDVLRILIKEGEIEESDDNNGVIIDYDKIGNVIGLEILDASQKVTNPRSVEYEVAPTGYSKSKPFVFKSGTLL